MEESLFPVGLVVDEEYLTFESMQAHEEGWDMEYVQLEPGAFHSNLKGVHTPRLQMAVQTYSTPMLLKGTYPPGSTLLYVIESEAAPIINEKPRAKNELGVGLEGDAVNVLINSSSVAYTIAVESTLWNRHFYEHFNLLFETYTQEHVLLIKTDTLTKFIDWIKAWVAYLSNDTLKATFETRYEGIEQEIINFVFEHIAFESKALQTKKFDVSEVKNLLEQRLKESVDMQSLAVELNISERQLFNVFKKVYGVTPKKYLQNLRLNAVKQELIDAQEGDVFISDIAYKYKFTHVSHFTSQYKKLFGTTPSTTLLKKRSR